MQGEKSEPQAPERRPGREKPRGERVDQLEGIGLETALAQQPLDDRPRIPCRHLSILGNVSRRGLTCVN
jgi:hypothetical protein